MTWTDFKLRYQGSVLGYLWAILKPLFIFLVLNFVFTNLFQGAAKNYSLQLLTGIILWLFFAEGTTMGMQSLLSKAHLITKVYIPKYIIVVASTFNVLISFCLNLVILAVFFAYYGVTPSLSAVAHFVFYIILIYFLILGFSFFLSTLFLRLRDLNQIWEVLLNAGFYAAPIIYPLTIIPEKYHKILFLNPMSFLIQYPKVYLIEGEQVPFGNNMVITSLVFVIFLAGLIFFKKTAVNSAEHI